MLKNERSKPIWYYFSSLKTTIPIQYNSKNAFIIYSNEELITAANTRRKTVMLDSQPQPSLSLPNQPATSTRVTKRARVDSLFENDNMNGNHGGAVNECSNHNNNNQTLQAHTIWHAPVTWGGIWGRERNNSGRSKRRS